MDAKTFLEELFGDKPESAHVCIWTFPSRRSHFFETVENAAAKVEQLKADNDVYVGCGLYLKNLGPVNRGSKEFVVGVPGFWMDIDVAGPTHKKADLPSDTNEAIELVTNNGFDPTIIINSGHGIHAWWLFKEPLIFDESATADSVELANELLQETIKNKAAQKGWKLDSTHDITRILRIPGTFNKKGGGSAPVTCIKSDGPRYGSPEDFEPFMATESLKPKVKVTTEEKRQIAKNITIDTNAEVPMQIDVMMTDPKFRATWMARRLDFEKDSPSEYVMSIASFCARWGLSDQEIADAIVSWYRQNLETPKFKMRENPISMEKLMRPTYVPGTIARARHQIDKDDAKDFVRQASDINDPEIKKDLEMTGEAARLKVSQAIGLNIVKIVKYVRGEKDPYYDMHTSTHVVQFKKPEDLFKLDKFKLRVAGVVDIMPDISSKDWKSVSRLFHEFMTEEHVDANQSTVSGRVRNWVESYLEDKTARKLNDVTFGNEPFVHKGNWHVFPKQFQTYTWQNCNVTGDISDIELDLRRAGAEKVAYNYPHPTRKGSRRKVTVWKVPNAVAQPPLMVVDDDPPTCSATPEPLRKEKEEAISATK